MLNRDNVWETRYAVEVGCVWKLVVSFLTGGKKKPLKQPKKAQGEMDEVSMLLCLEGLR